MPIHRLPQVPFGAVYFRKSNPPREDWERDYAVAAEDGLNVFRHWFMWSAIERKPGVYDWDDYDRQLDLAAKHGIRTVVAELTHTVPDWAYRKYATARQIRRDGSPLHSLMGPSASVGGFANNGGGAGALSMNCDEVRDAVTAFLTALATRYKGHPGLLGYDVWNEVNYAPDVDYSPLPKPLIATGSSRNTATSRLWPRLTTATPMPNGTMSSRRTKSGPTLRASIGSPSSATTTTGSSSTRSTPSAPSIRTA